MADHNTLIGSASGEIEAGTTLIDGVSREIEKGLALVGGVQREISLSKKIFTLTVSGGVINTGGSISITSIDRVQLDGSYLKAGTYDAEEGSTIKVTAYAKGSYYVTGKIYLNDQLVKETVQSTDASNAPQRSVSYSLTVSGDVSINCSNYRGKYGTNGTSGYHYGGIIKITTS